MQVFNQGRLHFREDGSQYFVGQPVMIRFKNVSEMFGDTNQYQC